MQTYIGNKAKNQNWAFGVFFTVEIINRITAGMMPSSCKAVCIERDMLLFELFKAFNMAVLSHVMVVILYIYQWYN